jgi:hypothetical protein
MTANNFTLFKSQAERIFVDIECLKDIGNKLLIKELAICKPDGSLQSWIFSAPYSCSKFSNQIKRQNNWITNHLHGIAWNDGVIPFGKMPDIFNTFIIKGSLVYIKGKEKCQLLEKKLPGRFIFDLEEIGCPQVEKINPSPFMVKCLHQHKNNRCALNKCTRYMNWFISDWLQLPLTVTVYNDRQNLCDKVNM